MSNSKCKNWKQRSDLRRPRPVSSMHYSSSRFSCFRCNWKKQTRESRRTKKCMKVSSRPYRPNKSSQQIKRQSLSWLKRKLLLTTQRCETSYSRASLRRRRRCIIWGNSTYRRCLILRNNSKKCDLKRSLRLRIWMLGRQRQRLRCVKRWTPYNRQHQRIRTTSYSKKRNSCKGSRSSNTSSMTRGLNTIPCSPAA